MTETISITSLAVMCDGKALDEYVVSDTPYSPRGEELLRLQEELAVARRLMAEKDERMCKMSVIQDNVDAEVQELTEKLFQEAYKMVNVAEEKREKAEKLLAESRLQVDVLSAEVTALKVLVQTPGMGSNHFQHTSPEHKSALAKLFSSSSTTKKSSNSSSSGNKKAATLPSTSSYVLREKEKEAEQKEADAVEEVDAVHFSEFTSWAESGHPSSQHAFIIRIQIEEVNPCMQFSNKKLASEVLESIIANQMELEPVNEDKPSVKPCSLTEVSRFCPYRIRTADDRPWHQISLLARNRLAAVCDYYTFVRYLRQGLIKAGLSDSYSHIVALRKNMCLAKLGLGFVPKTNLCPGF